MAETEATAASAVALCSAYDVLSNCDVLDKPQLKQLLPHMRTGCAAAGELLHKQCFHVLCSFLSSNDSTSRQVALSLLQASRKYYDSISSILSNKLQAGIQTVRQDDASSSQLLLNSCFAMFENFPAGLETINSNFYGLLQWLSTCLQHNVGAVRHAERGDSAGACSAVAVNKELCQSSAALAVMCIQRLKKRHAHLVTMMSCQLCPSDNAPSDDVSWFRDLLSSSLLILTKDVFSVETMTSAAVLATLVLRFANGFDSTTSSLPSPSSGPVLQQLLSVLGHGTTNCQWPAFAEAWSTLLLSELTVSGQRAMLHAFVTSLPKHVLFASISSEQSEKCLLLDFILPTVYTLCKSSDNSNLRVLSFRLLANIASEMKLAVSNPNLTSQMSTLRHRLLWTGPVVSEMIEFICNNWDDPVDVLRHQINSMFECLLLLHVAMHKDDIAQCRTLMQPTLHSLLSLSWQVRGKYPLLLSFAQHTQVAVMLDLRPTLPTDVLAVLGHMKLHSQASDLFNKLCGCHFEQMQNQCDTSDSSTMLQSWQKIWLDPLIHSLCAGGHRVRSHLTEFCLPVLFRNTPSSLAYLSTSLSSALLKQGDEPGILSALLLCLHHVRTAKTRQKMSQGKSAMCHTGHLEKGYAAVLRQALAHSSEEVRLNALALLCESRQTSEQLSRDDIELLRFFLPYNLASQDPSFRQRLETSMKKVLLRIQASLHVAVREAARLAKQLNVTTAVVADPLVDKREQSEKLHAYIDMCSDFLTWLVNMLVSCVEPCACFQRRAAALCLLLVITDTFPSTDTGTFSPVTILSTPATVQILMDNLLNESYSSNQELLVTLLGAALPSSSLGFQNAEYLDTYMRCMCWLASSPRAEDCTTSQYLLQILLKNYMECWPVEVVLPVELFTCPLASGQSVSAPALSIPLENSDIVAQDKATGALAFAVTSQLPLHSRLLKIWCQYLFCIKHRLDVAQRRGLLASLSECSLYGLVSSLRTLLSRPSVTKHLQCLAADTTQCTSAMRFLSDCIDMCVQLADVVQAIVCDDTPEGYSVDEVSDHGLSSNPDLATKDFQSQLVVVCSWRCLKEAALLLAHLLQVCAVPTPSSRSQLDLVFLSAQQVQDIGAFFVKQLIASRHLGAFEQVHTGFVVLCQQLWKFSDPCLNELPVMWVKALLSDLKRSLSPTDTSLSITRRSAGLPRYVQAILVTQPPSQNYSCMRMVIQELMQLVAQPVEAGETVDATLSQAHGINILCALFREAKLGPHITPFVADTLVLAIQGFAHSVWAIRNSSTLLFRALIGRIFGVNTAKPSQPKTNRMTGREFFSRFPDLYPRLLDMLTEAVASGSTENNTNCHRMLEPRLFPLLLLLSHLIPSVSSLSLQSFTPLVMRCSSVSVWQARVMAAESLVPLVALDELAEIVKKLASSLPLRTDPGISFNAVHGTLLQLYHLVTYHTEHAPSSTGVLAVSQLLPLLWQKRWIVSSENHCTPVRALAVELFVKCSFIPVTSSDADGTADEQLAALQASTQSYLHTVARQFAVACEPCASACLQSLKATDLTHHQLATSLATAALAGQEATRPARAPSGDEEDDAGASSCCESSEDKQLLSALLSSDCYEAQMTILKHYSAVCQQVSNTDSANTGTRMGNAATKATKGAARARRDGQWLTSCLVKLFMRDHLYSLCRQKAAQLLSQYLSTLENVSECSVPAETCVQMLHFCSCLLKRREKCWDSFGQVLLLMSHLLRLGPRPSQDMWDTWLASLDKSCDPALSWTLHMFAASSLKEILAMACVAGHVRRASWIHAVQLLQAEDSRVRHSMSAVVMSVSVTHALVVKSSHLQASRSLPLALVVMAALCCRDNRELALSTLTMWARSSDVLSQASHASQASPSPPRPDTAVTTATNTSAGQLFLKSDLNSYYEASFLAKEATLVLEALFSDQQQQQVSIGAASSTPVDVSTLASEFICRELLPWSSE